MRSISLPFSDLIGYLQDTLDDWPIGYKLERGEESKVLTDAAAAFAMDYVRLSVPHLHDDADPLRQLITVLGYPVKAMSEEEIEDLEETLDDHYLSLSTIMDVSMDGLIEFLKNKEVTVERAPSKEDIIIFIEDDLRLVRLRRVIAKLKDRMPPKKIDHTNIEEMELIVARYMTSVFKSVDSDAVRIEVKRIFTEELTRH